MSSISVALCTYNGAPWIAAQLQSILAQTQPPAEIIICDDRSTDTTAAEIARIAQATTIPIRLTINPETLGISRNFQKAMHLCTADYIALSDQDDLWHPRKLEALSRALDARPDAAYTFCDARLVDQQLSPLGIGLWELHQLTPQNQRILQGDDSMQLMTIANFATGATMLLRRSWLESALPIAPSWLHDGWLSLMLCAFSHCVLVDEQLVDYRQHPAQKVGACRRDELRRLRWQRAMNRDFFARESRRWLDAWRFLSDRRHLLRRRSDLDLVRTRAQLDHDRLELRLEPESRWDHVAQHAFRGHYAHYAWGKISAAVDLLLHE